MNFQFRLYYQHINITRVVDTVGEMALTYPHKQSLSDPQSFQRTTRSLSMQNSDPQTFFMAQKNLRNFRTFCLSQIGKIFFYALLAEVSLHSVGKSPTRFCAWKIFYHCAGKTPLTFVSRN